MFLVDLGRPDVGALGAAIRVCLRERQSPLGERLPHSGIFHSLCLTLFAALLTRWCPDGTTAADDWPAYGHDAGGTRYSPLQTIDRDNVKQLKIA